ncbi:MAG: hypothetical protein AB7F25_07115 [Deferribacterales bacterium]
MLEKKIIQRTVSIVDAGWGKTAEVLWVDMIVETVSDVENVLSENNRRCAYGVDDKERFLSEVADAESYITILGW